MKTLTRALLALSLTALFAAPPAAAQWSQVHEQFYLPATHNWQFRENYRVADRLFNAFDYGHAILYEVLYDDPDAPVSKLEEDEYRFITQKLLVKPPRVPLEEAAIEVAYAKLAPEAKAMFEWVHILHRQIYDILAMEELSDQAKDDAVAEVVRYYKTRPDLAFSSEPKTMELMEGQYYSTVFRTRYPKFNGLIWAYHWLQVGLYEPLLVGGSLDERQTGITATVARFWQMIERAPLNMPRIMPMTAAVAPTFAARYPEAAIVFDNLHSMHDVVSDILVSTEVPRDRKRAEILIAAERFRDRTSFVTTEAGWREMAGMMGLNNMGGPAVGFLPEFPTPTVERGAVLAGMDHGGMAGMSGGGAGDMPGMAPPAGVDAHAGMPEMDMPVQPAMSMEEMMAVYERMMADPVIRERIATDTVLRGMMRMMPGAGNSPNAGHDMPMAHEDAAARAAMEFVTLLLSDPAVEDRIRADPELHRLWSDHAVQSCLKTMRALEAAGRPLPPTCPAVGAAPRDGR
ncbi:MAG: hypothetical protein EXR95_04490 [Gemmatimonadetes bacterium]|nr:hypothetical protein [Gemmatimonadota bacterium]